MILTRIWLEDYFDDAVLARGETCFENGQVCDVDVLDHGRAMNGEVMGEVVGEVADEGDSNGHVRYSVYVDLDDFGVDGDCSCAIGYNCEHVAALLFAQIAAQHGDGLPIPTDKTEALPAPQSNEHETNQFDQDVEELRQQELSRCDYPPNVHQRILYFLRPETAHAAPGKCYIRVHVVSARALHDGGFAAPSPFHLSNLANHVLHRFILPVDSHILTCISPRNSGKDSFLPVGTAGAELMTWLLKTGRCYWSDSSRPALKMGEPRSGTWHWHIDDGARQYLNLRASDSAPDQPALPILPVSPPCYVDQEHGICGMLQTPCPDDLCEQLLFIPPVEPDDPLALGGLSYDWPNAIAKPKTLHIRRNNLQPTPVLQLMSEPQEGIRLMFDYGGRLLPLWHGQRNIYYRQDSRWQVTEGVPDTEMAAIQQLYAVGLMANPGMETSDDGALYLPHW